jgi:hypothetical protein
MNYRPNESFDQKQQRKQYVYVVYCRRNNLWQDSEAVGKYQVLCQDRLMVTWKMTQEVGRKKGGKDRCKCGTLVYSDRRLGVICKCWQGYGNLFGGTKICWQSWHPLQCDIIVRHFKQFFQDCFWQGGTINSRSASLHKESISQATAAASAEVSDFAFTWSFWKLNCHTSYVVSSSDIKIISINKICFCLKQNRSYFKNDPRIYRTRNQKPY